MARQRIPCLAEAGACTCAACLSMYECLHSTTSMIASQHGSHDITILHQNQQPELPAGCVHICLRLFTLTNVTSAYVYLDSGHLVHAGRSVGSCAGADASSQCRV